MVMKVEKDMSMLMRDMENKIKMNKIEIIKFLTEKISGNKNKPDGINRKLDVAEERENVKV